MIPRVWRKPPCPAFRQSWCPWPWVSLPSLHLRWFSWSASRRAGGRDVAVLPVDGRPQDRGPYAVVVGVVLGDAKKFPGRGGQLGEMSAVEPDPGPSERDLMALPGFPGRRRRVDVRARGLRPVLEHATDTGPSPSPSPVSTLPEMYQREYAVLLLGIWRIDHRINNWSASQSRNGWQRRGLGVGCGWKPRFPSGVSRCDDRPTSPSFRLAIRAGPDACL